MGGCTSVSVDTNLHRAARLKDVKWTKSLLHEGAAVNAKGPKGHTVLFHAIFHGAPGEILDDLIAAGADTCATDDRGWTSLILAANRGFTDVVQKLLDKGADPHFEDPLGHTARWHSMTQGHDSTAKLLEQWESLERHYELS
mmetsp:Transcript_88067/g.174766  ORF Transcript_88067/g.174766 Transcript_88067/m.174766 type:complete len:142 (+) Transcript_88067:81-506(+)